MGRVRAREFDAVIGVGGLSAEPRSHGIDGRVTWVGVGARRGASIPVGHRVTARSGLLSTESVLFIMCPSLGSSF